MVAGLSLAADYACVEGWAELGPHQGSADYEATLYILDEPTTGLQLTDVEALLTQLEGLVDAGNTVILVEHDMHVVSASDWVVDIGPGAGEEGGRIVAEGPPGVVAKVKGSRTAGYLGREMSGG